MGIRLLLVLSLAIVATAQHSPSGVKVRGRLKGVPVDAPAGLIQIALVLDGRSMEVPVGRDGAFEFVGVPPGTGYLRSSTLSSALIEVGDRDIEAVEVVPDKPHLLGQVTIDTGEPLPPNRDPVAPVFRLEARPVSGRAVWHKYLRSDGVFLFFPIPSGDYRIQVTLIPAGYAVKSITYAGMDALHAPIKLDPALPSAFLRVVLTAAANAPDKGPAELPVLAEIAPASGDASLIASESGEGPGYIEGKVTFFSVRSKDPGIFSEERRLGVGEECFDPWFELDDILLNDELRTLLLSDNSRSCQPLSGDRMALSLPAGNYQVSGYVRVCGGNCKPSALGSPTDECHADLVIRRGETLYVDRVQSPKHTCVMVVSSKPRG